MLQIITWRTNHCHGTTISGGKVEVSSCIICFLLLQVRDRGDLQYQRQGSVHDGAHVFRRHVEGAETGDQRERGGVGRGQDGTEGRERGRPQPPRYSIHFSQEVNESPETLKYLWYPELEIYGLETFGRQRVLKEMSGVRMGKNKTINYELG